MKSIFFTLCTVVLLSSPAFAQSTWHAYGGTDAGTRYMPYDQITPDNVHQLETAWTYRTGELGQDARDGHDLTFEATPIFFENTLYFATAFGKIIALDAKTGQLKWDYDPEIDRSWTFSEVTSRGVSLWQDTSISPSSPCQARIVEGTIDARLIAVDARTGAPCTTFGDQRSR